MTGGHFLASPSQVSVWWQEGFWRYRLLDTGEIWQGPADPDLQGELTEITGELSPDGDLVPGSEQGVVTIIPAPDHRSTEVWFCKDKEWINLEGYNFDAIQGVQRLVDLTNTDQSPDT